MAVLLSSAMTCSYASAQAVQVLETTADGKQLLAHSETGFSRSPGAAKVHIEVDADTQFQQMDGFGASLTDSSASLLARLPAEQRKQVMQELFAPEGPLGLTLLRQPIGASDFSAHGDYSYDDVPGGRPDTTLAAFSAAPDRSYLFPLLREAEHLNPQLRVIALPWSAPAWMKSNHSMRAGSLEDQYLETYARYLARSVETFSSEGVPIFALSLQNEPLNENASYPTQLMPPAQEAKLAAALRLLLVAHGRSPLLFGYEHNWDHPDYPAQLLKTADELTPAGSAPLFAGISWHCYGGDESAQMTFLKDHPRSGIWFTECSGTYRDTFADSFLWQAKHLLLGAPLNEARSVMLWNLVLDPHGDPHNGGCGDCRALLTLEQHPGKPATLGRNVEYYILAHAAPFVHPGAVRVAGTVRGSRDLETTAYRNLDGTFVVLVLNASPEAEDINVDTSGVSVFHRLPGRSLTTFTWGTATPTVLDGVYRFTLERKEGGGEEQFLEAAKQESLPGWRPVTTMANQLWSVRRLATGRYEIRNVATAQSLAIAQNGLLATVALDGSHIAPLALKIDGNGICIVSPSASPCHIPAAAEPLKQGLYMRWLAPSLPPPL
ncbi:glycoside hydrolase family 30 beta sandwich domain-containing protein [Granulicella arctica]|uniref:Glucosylceramidase n=1 Tax=Granulicella arctica TaxID=940613 RepID=A0A7Y9PGN9_9BACT|nr:glycoside hydrolase family 30 beta sandwich domain-containing protein [Granulicella arctica]NYF79565.1 glucosylceramidase [Granulicella arctica]